MAVSAGLGFDIDEFGVLMQKAKEADKALDGVVSKMQTLSHTRISGDVEQYLDRLREMGNLVDGISKNPLNINIDTAKLNEGKDALDQIVSTVNSIKTLTDGGKLEFFDPQKLYATDEPVALLRDRLKEVNSEIERLDDKIREIDAADIVLQAFPKGVSEPRQEEYLDNFPALSPEGAKWDKRTKEYKEAWAKHKAAVDKANEEAQAQYERRKTLFDESKQLWDKEQALEVSTIDKRAQKNEERAILQRQISWADKTVAEKEAIVNASNARELKAEQDKVNQIIKEYQRLLAERKRIEDEMNRYRSASDSGKDLSQDEFKTFQELQDAWSRNKAEIEAKEREHQAILTDIDTSATEHRLQVIKDLEARAYSKDEALALAAAARNVYQMKDAQIALQSAINSADYEAEADDIDELKKKFEELREKIEATTRTKQKDNTLEPSRRNEYAKTVRELEKLKNEMKSLEEAEQDQMRLSGSVDDHSAFKASLQARIDALEAEKQTFDQTNQQIIEETKKLEAEKTRIAIEEYKKRVAELKAYEEKFGVMSVSDAQQIIIDTQSVANVRQAEEAVKNLKDARDKLDKNDSEYEQTLKSLNKEIQKQEDYIQSVTNAEKYQAEQERKYNETYDGAKKYAKQAKSLNELKKAMDYLAKAREKEDVGSEKYQELSIELNKTKKEYEDYANTVKDSSKDITQVADKLKRSLIAAFSVSAIKGYISKLVEVRGEFELQQRSLQAILQNKEKADQLWNKTVALAVQSPFRIKQLVTYTKQLAAYRIETDKLYDTTKMLADISSGLGVDMDRLILAYGQVRAASYLRGTELRQFTEAGIPLLEELAKRFSELEGRAVSVGDVFARISKRMVDFEDVDAVLRKLTSENGIFFQMQEKQAETLKGQISNLKDSIDVMLNEVGKSTEGILNGSISFVRSLVENWQKFIPVLKAVAAAFVLYKVNALLADKALMKFAISQGIVTAGSSKLSKVLALTGASFKKMFLTLNKGLAINPWILAIVALLAAIRSMFQWSQKLTEAIAEQNQKYYDQVAGINKIVDAYRGLIAEEKKEGANSDEIFSKKEEQLNNLIKIAEERGIKLPVELGKIDKENIDQVVEQMRDEIIWAEDWGKEFGIALTQGLNAPQGNIFGWHTFGDNLATDLEQLDKALENINRQAVKTSLDQAENEILARYEELPQKAKEYFDELEKGKKDEETEQEFLERRIQKLTEIGYIIKNNRLKSLNSEEKLFKSYHLLVRDAKEGRKKVMYDLTAIANEMLKIYGVDDFSELTKEQQANVQLQIDKKFADMELSEELKRWGAKFMAEKFKIPYVLTPAEDQKKPLERWQEEYNEFIKDLETKSVKAITDAETSREKEVQNLESLIKEQQYIVDAFEKGGESVNKAEYAEAVKILADLKKARRWIIGNVPDKGEDKELKRLNDQISIVKKLTQEFKKLNKTKSASATIDILKDENGEFRDVFKELGISKLLEGLSPESILDENGVFDINKWTTTALKNLEKGLARADLRTILKKATAGFEVEIGLKADEKKIDAFKDSISTIFDSVELTKELKDLGFTDELAETFGFEFIDLKDARTKIEALKDNAAKMGDDGVKIYEEALKKIDDLEVKAMRERMKTYSKYLVAGYSERVKLKIEEMKKIKEIEESKEFTPEQKVRITQGVEKETNKALQKQEWEDFKNSEMYTMVFDDLEHYGSMALNVLQEKLESLKGSLSDLDATEVKEIISQINKIEDVMIERNPFAYMKDLKKQLKSMKSEEEYQIDLFNAREQEAQAQSIIDSIDIINSKKDRGVELTDEEMADYASLLAITSALGMTEDEYRQSQVESVDKAKKAGKEAQNNLNVYKRVDKTLQAQSDAWGDIGGKINDTFDASKELMTALGVSTDSLAYSLVESAQGMSELIVQAVQFGLKMKIIGYETNMALGVIGWILIAIQAIAKIISAIVNAQEAAFKENIDNYQKSIEKLKKTYEELEKQIDEAWSTVQMKAYQRELNQTYKTQLAYQKSIIAAYEDEKEVRKGKKNTDKYKEYQEELDNLKEMEEAFTETTKNIFSKITDGILDDVLDATRGFVDAWYDAFVETGDGLKGLEENFDEMFLNIVKQQAALLVSDQFIKRWKARLEELADNEGGKKDNVYDLTVDEVKQWAKEVKDDLPQLSEMIEPIFEGVKDFVGNGSGLTALEKGISGITEESAQVIESYLNSLRSYVAINGEQLKEQTNYLRNLWNFFDGIGTSTHPNGGFGLKVVI